VKTCHTTTCFSCRKRVAAGAPVRRYNATSARTLAIYLASQDNPELGLCHNPSADRLIPPAPTRKPRKGHGSTEKGVHGSVLSTGRKNSDVEKPTARIHESSQTTPASRPSVTDKNNDTATQPSISKEEEAPAISLLEEPTTTDHRSFVQNVFGTIAFKMVEWLAPKNLEVISRPVAREGPTPNEKPMADAIPSSEVLSTKALDPAVGEIKETRHASSSQVADRHTPQGTDSLNPKPYQKPVKAGSRTNEISPSPEAKAVTNSVTKCTPKINGRRKSDQIETTNPKSILNLSSRMGESPPEVKSLPQYRPHQPFRKLSTPHQTLITNPAMHTHAITKPFSTKSVPEHNHLTTTPEVPVKLEPEPPSNHRPRKKSIEKEVGPELPPIEDSSLPQSLSLLPIDLLNFLCDTLQLDGTAEKHDLQPAEVSQSLKRWLNSNSPYAIGRTPGSKPTFVNPSRAKDQWKEFIHQGIFDVLSKPASLIQSFSYCDQRLYDTQTIWYLMLRLTRVAPSLVLDSLWIAAGDLFNPPEALSSLHDWSRDSAALSKSSLSSGEAARLINICLHALVATAPLVTDARQLANMSRIRSFGLAMLGRETSSLEPVKLCLEYEDAFTNDLSMRLARRLFASIPTRRHFAELAELQKDLRSDSKKEPDVLEGVLSTLKFLDLGMTPALEFHDQERDLHEKRVPTLLLDWARTVMLQDWNGSAEVSADGSFGGALAMMAAICELLCIPCSVFDL
jgi:hypothetical protein